MAHGRIVNASSDPTAAAAEREAARRAFLAAAGLGDARREPLAGDASTRRYERLHPPGGGAPLILMDAPPSAESAPAPAHATPQARTALGYNACARLAASRVEAFAAVAAWLRGRGLSAPAVHALDAGAGLAVLENLGDDLYARRIEAGAPAEPLYAAAVDLLAGLAAVTPPTALAYMDETGAGAWPLPAYDDLALRTGADVFLDWFPAHARRPAFAPDARAEWEALWAPARARGEAGAAVFTHRDYHAENLLWLDERAGAARVGLLDFQDAVRGHPAWDLASLLQDARRDVEPALEAAMLDRYLAARPGLDGDAFRLDYAGLAALNAARILGVFSRLVARDGKPRYARFMPRVWAHLRRDLVHPEFAPLRAWFDRHVPAEARA